MASNRSCIATASTRALSRFNPRTATASRTLCTGRNSRNNDELACFSSRAASAGSRSTSSAIRCRSTSSSWKVAINRAATSGTTGKACGCRSNSFRRMPAHQWRKAESSPADVHSVGSLSSTISRSSPSRMATTSGKVAAIASRSMLISCARARQAAMCTTPAMGS